MEIQHQIKTSVTNPTIANIYQDIISEKLILKPDFQRRFVWTHDHQENFIDTILKGYPFPEIYVCQGETDTKKVMTKEYVIDGQQRLTTIKKYIENDYDKPLKNIPKFEDLGEEKQKNFLSYHIVVRNIGILDDSDIKEIFRRINLTQFKLKDVEIHNTIYDGEFIQTANDILDNIDLDQFPVFSESQLTRMADLDFLLLVMSTLEEGGYFPEHKEMERYIAQFNDNYPQKNKMKALLINVFDVIKDLNIPIESIWFRKSAFFTLVVEIAKHQGNITENMTQKLVDLEKNIIANKHKDNEFGNFYKYMYAGTNSRKARVERALILNKYTYDLTVFLVNI